MRTYGNERTIVTPARGSGKHKGGIEMTTTFVDRRRPWVSTINLLLAVAAVVIAVIALALARDDAATPAANVTVLRPVATSALTPTPYYGCYLRFGNTQC